MNYKHLHYFWVVAREGTIARAAEVLHLTPQTISAQISNLEEELGRNLFRRSGGRLHLTADGEIAYAFARDIFTLGEELQDVLYSQGRSRRFSLKMGLTSTLPKTLIYRFLVPCLRADESPRLVCTEGQLPELLEELSARRLDLVLANQPLPHGQGLRGHSYQLGETGMSLVAAPSLARLVQGESMPAVLEKLPLLLPNKGSSVRDEFDLWMREYSLRANVVMELNDTALGKTFAQQGVAAMFVPMPISAQVQRQYELVELDRTFKVRERYYAIAQRGSRIDKLLVQIIETAREILRPEAATEPAEPEPKLKLATGPG